MSTICTVARGASFAHRGRRSARSARVSRVPCRNSIGTSTRSKMFGAFRARATRRVQGKAKEDQAAYALGDIW